MNQIRTIQNSQKQLERLAAQRELYSSAKRLFNLQLVGNVLVPLALSFISTIRGNFSIYVAIYGICFFVVDTLLVEPGIKQRKNKAAKVQELFDSDVLELPKSPFKTVEDITVEEVLINYDAHRKIQSNIERIKNWYNVNLDGLDISIARLVCQRINYSWECRLRRAYESLLKILNVILPLLVIGVALFAGLKINELVLIGAGLLPLFRFVTKQHQENRESRERLTKLNSHFDKVWGRVIGGEIDKDVLEETARRIQDEIYENRIKSPLIPDLFYRLYRPKEEALMAKGADSLVAEFRKVFPNR